MLEHMTGYQYHGEPELVAPHPLPPDHGWLIDGGSAPTIAQPPAPAAHWHGHHEEHSGASTLGQSPTTAWHWHGYGEEHGGASTLGQPPATAAHGHGYGEGHGAGSTSSSAPSAANQTLVGSPGGLQIDLLWDPSVAQAPKDFKPAVTEAANYLTTVLSGKDEVINLDVGWGEVGGSPLPANALGESSSNGYLTDYATVEGAVNAPAATNEPTADQFFVTSAEAKALGLVSASSSSVDGSIGFSTLSSTGFSWDYNTATTPIAANQFDLQAIAQHEMTEVMGRIGMEGQTINGSATYTPLDLFNFSGPHALSLAASGGYFSTDAGQSQLGVFNDATLYGGDIADWASALSPTQSGTQGLAPGNYDAFDAFAPSGHAGQVTSSDVSEMLALGYAPQVA